MQNTVENGVTSDKKHSGYGILSMVMSVSAGVMFSPLWWSIATRNCLDGLSLRSALLILAVESVAWCFSLIGLYHALQKTRKELFAFVGSFWSSLTLFAMFYPIGLMIILR